MFPNATRPRASETTAAAETAVGRRPFVERVPLCVSKLAQRHKSCPAEISARAHQHTHDALTAPRPQSCAPRAIYCSSTDRVCKSRSRRGRAFGFPSTWLSRRRHSAWRSTAARFQEIIVPDGVNGRGWPALAGSSGQPGLSCEALMLSAPPSDIPNDRRKRHS